MNRTRRYVFKPKQRKGKIGYRPRVLKIRPGADAGLKKVFASIGVPDKKPFKPDVFQLEALSAIRDTDCLVTVPKLPCLMDAGAGATGHGGTPEGAV